MNQIDNLNDMSDILPGSAYYYYKRNRARACGAQLEVKPLLRGIIPLRQMLWLLHSKL